MKIQKLLLILLFIPFADSAPRNCSELWPCRKALTEGWEMLWGQDSERYVCSSKSQSDWYETGEIRIGWGIYYISSGVFFNVIAWPVIYVFLSQNELTGMYSVFNVMGVIGIIECTEIWGVSIWPGWAALNGEVYCTSPTLATFFGKLTMVQWITGTTSAIFLGLYRLSEATNQGAVLYNSPLKTGLWLFLFLCYGIYGSLFYDTVLFNSKYMAPLLDPHVGNSPDQYSNEFLRLHNCAASIALVIIYTWMTIETLSAYKNKSAFQKKLDIRVLIQAVSLCLTYVIPALSFVLIYVISSPPQWLILFADLSYQLSGGLPFIMYICVNRKIRFELKKMYKNTIGRVCKSQATIPVVQIATMSTNFSTSTPFFNRMH